MKILCINITEEDYLADTFLLGLKEIYGKNVAEYPVKNILYQNADLSQVRGGGFTYYGTLPQELAKKCTGLNTIKDYDLVVFTCIYKQYDIFRQLLPQLDPRKTILLDGEDKENIFLYAFKYWKKPKYWFSQKPHQRFCYFKREITPKTIQSLYYKVIPHFLASYFPLHRHIFPISFGIPSCKIIEKLPQKNKRFAAHIVDEEIKKRLGSESFKGVTTYYQDIQQSQYGITTKRGGWDCLRHYEIAANGAVICFKDLDKKPALCAPHGLIAGKNCLSYRNYDDLMQQIEQITENDYEQLLRHSMSWIRSKTCEMIVKESINIFKNNFSNNSL